MAKKSKKAAKGNADKVAVLCRFSRDDYERLQAVRSDNQLSDLVPFGPWLSLMIVKELCEKEGK